MEKKTIVLMRVSSDVQDLDSQRNVINDYINKNDIVVDEWLEEKGVSGFRTKIEDREALMKIKEMAKNGELEQVITYSWDRIGRRPELVGFMIYLSECGVKVMSVTEGCFNEDKPFNDLKNYLLEILDN